MCGYYGRYFSAHVPSAVWIYSLSCGLLPLVGYTHHLFINVCVSCLSRP